MEWATQVASRRRDLIGALAETVLERRLAPLEHTAIDTALSAAVVQNQVPTSEFSIRSVDAWAKCRTRT